MDIQQLSGESALLQKLLGGRVPGQDVVVGNGDDAAVIRIGGELVAVSTDTVVAGRHFDRRFSSFSDVGMKAIEAAASDIVAMGGAPEQIYLAVTVPQHMPVEELQELYHGIYAACARINSFVLGGDTTTGAAEFVLTVTVVGRVKSAQHLSTRAGARVGDLLCVSGDVGGAAAGLLAYQRGIEGFEICKARHRTPRCRLDLVDVLGPIATAMIDVSDGISSEVHHLCRMSGVGARVAAEAVPLHTETIEIARNLGIDPLSLALSGGDDYELLFTVAPSDRSGVRGVVIGEITPQGGIVLERDGAASELPNTGYSHIGWL